MLRKGKDIQSRPMIKKDASVKSRIKHALRPTGTASRSSAEQEAASQSSQPATANNGQLFTFQPPSIAPPQPAPSSSSIQPPSTNFTFSFSTPSTVPPAPQSIRPPAPHFPIDQSSPSPIEALPPGEIDALIAAETVSLTSSITDYTYENGRRYHSYRAGKYALPNDTLEAERLDIVHHLSLLFLSGDLYTSPVRQLASSGRLRRALDAGTGTGIWAMEFGHEFPGCEVVGVDLSPIQPTHVPPNVRFEVDDLEDEWLWDAPFDYIHIRTLLGSIASWPTFLSNCYAHTTPGGYVELQEIDLTNVFSADGTYESHAHAYQHYNSLLFQAGHLTGRRFDLAPELPRMMQEAGFVDVKVQRFTQPLGHWPRRKREREIAFWSVESMVSGLEAYGLALFTRVLGVGMEEARGVCERARRDLLREGVHTCCTWWMVSGRRPEEGEGGDEEMDG